METEIFSKEALTAIIIAISMIAVALGIMLTAAVSAINDFEKAIDKKPKQ